MNIEMNWGPNPAADNVTQYHVWHGSTNACANLMTTVPASTSPMSASIPPQGLGYAPGSIIYVGLSAVNAQGESAKLVFGPFAIPMPAVAAVPSATATVT